MDDLKTLKCLSKETHEAHDWEFKYDRPPTPYRCPGVDEKESK